MSFDVNNYYRPLDKKGCICHLRKWQIHPSVSRGTLCPDIPSSVSSLADNIDRPMSDRQGTLSLCGDSIYLLSHVFYCWLCIPDDAMAQQYNNIIPAHLHIYRHWAKINTAFVNGNNNSDLKKRCMSFRDCPIMEGGGSVFRPIQGTFKIIIIIIKIRDRGRVAPFQKKIIRHWF